MSNQVMTSLIIYCVRHAVILNILLLPADRRSAAVDPISGIDWDVHTNCKQAVSVGLMIMLDKGLWACTVADLKQANKGFCNHTAYHRCAWK